MDLKRCCSGDLSERSVVHIKSCLNVKKVHSGDLHTTQNGWHSVGGSCQDEQHVSSPSAGQCLVYWPEYLKGYTDYSVFKIHWCHPSHKSCLCWLYHMHQESCVSGCFPFCCSLLLHDQGHFTSLDPTRASHLHQSALKWHELKTCLLQKLEMM